MMQDTMTAHLPSCFIDALHTRFAQANKILVALARSGAHARWSDRVRIVPSHVVLNPPRIAAKIIQALQSALLNHTPIEVAYQSLQVQHPRRAFCTPGDSCCAVRRCT
jgi:hypothetical protein